MYYFPKKSLIGPVKWHSSGLPGLGGLGRLGMSLVTLLFSLMSLEEFVIHSLVVV